MPINIDFSNLAIWKKIAISYQLISSNGVTLSKLRMGMGRAMPYWVGEIVPAGENSMTL